MLGLDLIAAHMVGDYIFQTDWMARYKLSSWKVRLLHVVCYCIAFFPIVYYYNSLWFVVWLAVTHFITDSRRWASDEGWKPKPILVDQTIHLVTLSILGHLFLWL